MPRNTRAALAGVGVLSVLAAALIVLLWVQAGEGDDESPGAGAEVAARGAATAYFTVDHRDAEETVEQVLSLATGAFARTYDAGSEALVRGIERQELVSTAVIPDDGVAQVEASADRATYLVAVDVSTERAGEQPSQRGYRTVLELALVDGAWKVASFEEVP